MSENGEICLLFLITQGDVLLLVYLQDQQSISQVFIL